MKTFFMLILSFCTFTSSAQTQPTQFKYISNGNQSVGILTISGNAFRFDGFQSIMKTNDGNIYQYSQSDRSCSAFKSTYKQYAGSNLLTFTPESGGEGMAPIVISKCDTTYFKPDSVINGFKCHKIGLNYQCDNVISKTQRVPAPPESTTIWVAADFKTSTPFTFRSKTVTGLILRYERKTFNTPIIITVDPDYHSGANVPGFQLPKGCKVFTSFEKHQEASMAPLMKKMNELQEKD